MRGKTLFLCNFRAASRGVAGATAAKRPVGMKEEPQNLRRKEKKNNFVGKT